ncbi:MAG: DUF697 domain-containing protein [Anaeroplasmataceae bacterium]
MSKKLKVKKKKNFSPIWYVFGIGAIIVFLLFLVSSVLTVGEKFSNITKYGKFIEWGFYILVVVLLYFFFINPLRIILFSPSLNIITTLDDSKKHKYNHLYKKVAKNIVKNNDLPQHDVELLTNYHNIDELKINLQIVFDTSVKKNLNDIILKNAKIVMISTAISQNARVDMFTVYGVNLNLIKELVLKCGFRPSMKNLSKLSIKVLSTALIANGIESLSLDDVLPNSAISALGEIPFIKPVISSVIQGATNALLTLRIGVVTRKYLFKDGNEITRESIRHSAWKESAKLIPQLIADTFTFVPKKVVNLFKSKNKEENNEVKLLEAE